jgi:hypothetical protein
VEYRTTASPADIAAFYQSIAAEQGFSDSGGFAGIHQFKQDGTDNSFSYGVATEGGASIVSYRARSFDRGP